MTYESLLKLAREGKTIYVKLKGFRVIHQVTAFSNMEYCVGGAYFKYASDIYEILTGEIDPTNASERFRRAKETLAFYADETNYDQVDILGKCGLSDDADVEEGRLFYYGKRARETLAELEKK